MKIAVASSDGIVINQHFGHAQTFYIYEKKEKEIRFLEQRKGRPFCHSGNHDDADLKSAIELLADCQFLYALQIGKGAQNALLEKEILPKTGRGMILDVLAQEEL